MNLNNLPKDMLVELVSKIGEDVEKDHSNYIVFQNKKCYFFEEEKKLREFLLYHLFKYHHLEDVFTVDNYSEIKAHEMPNFISSLAIKYSLEELLKIVKHGAKTDRSYDPDNVDIRIVKGKLIHQ